MSLAESGPIARNPMTLDDLRAIANKFFTVIAVVLWIATTVVAWAGGQNAVLASAVSLGGVVAIVAAVRVYGETLPAMVMVSAAFAVQEMMLIFAASNLDPARVQEAHMIYFVLNAFLLLYASWKSVIVYNVLIVLHHFVLTFVQPDFIWTEGGAPAALSHLAVHAAIAIILGVPLLYIAEQLRRMIADNQDALAAAARAAATAMAKTDEAERSRNLIVEERGKAEKIQADAARTLAAVIEQLGGGLARLSGGDLTYRLTEDFARDYRKLQDDFNAAVGKLEETLAVISGSIRSISSGAGEITQASKDSRAPFRAAGRQSRADRLGARGDHRDG